MQSDFFSSDSQTACMIVMFATPAQSAGGSITSKLVDPAHKGENININYDLKSATEFLKNWGTESARFETDTYIYHQTKRSR